MIRILSQMSITITSKSKMNPFKNGILARLEEIYTFAKGNHMYLGPDGYKIAITALLGFTPTNWEIDEVFIQRTGLNFQELKEIVQNKLKYFYIEQYISDIFNTFDKECNGYISLRDVRMAWESLDMKVPWSKIEESFKELAKNGVIDYSDFYEIITEESIVFKSLKKYNNLLLK